MDFGAYARAFGEQWTLLLGGSIVSLVVIGWDVILRRRRVSGMDIAPLIASAFLASMVAWNEEHKARNDEHAERVKAETKIAELEEKSTPRFVASVDMYLVGMSDADAINDLFLQLTIIDQGAPSLLSGYRVHIAKNGHPELAVPLAPIPPDLFRDKPDSLQKALVQFQVEPDTALDLKTSHPWEHAGMARGWLRFVLPGIPNAELEGATVWVTFVDYLQHEHSSQTFTYQQAIPFAGDERVDMVCPGLKPEKR